MATIKAYNGILFIVELSLVEFGETLLSLEKLSLSKDEAEIALKLALCEFVNDKPMLNFWAVKAKLESGEILEITQRGTLPWDWRLID